MKRPCPDSELIGDYLEGHLSEEERMRLQEHFSECDECLDRLMVVNDLVHHRADLKLEPVPGRATQAARRLVAEQNTGLAQRVTKKIGERVSDLSEKLSEFFQFVPWGAPQLQAVRHKTGEVGKDLVFLHNTLKGVAVQIEIERIGPSTCDIKILFEGDPGAGQGIRVHIEKGNREMASTLSEGDEILFEGIPFGRYNLVFAKNGADLGSIDLEIAQKGCGTR